MNIARMAVILTLTMLMITSGVANASRPPIPTDPRFVSHHDRLKPEPIPPGLVRQARAQARLCTGDGVSGNRYQVWLVRERGEAKKRGLNKSIKAVRRLADAGNAAIIASAAETGGFRSVHYVENENCQIDVKVMHVEQGFPANRVFNEVFRQVPDQSTRNHLAFIDTSHGICGIGSFWLDDKPGPDNLNNTGNSLALIGRPCWGFNVVAHEIGHNLGAVQDTAPHSTLAAHCWDEWETMCYDDNGPISKMVEVCPKEHNGLYDCNHDDYFHTNPDPGSYLDTHWNSADNVFLFAEEGASRESRGATWKKR